MKVRERFGNDEIIDFKAYASKCGVENIDTYLAHNVSLLADLNNYEDMYKGAKLLLNSNKHIYILADTDLDGAMSSSIASLYLNALEMPNTVIYHEEKPKSHGLDSEIIEKLLCNEPSVLWIPDAGTNNLNEISELVSKGWKVILTDHHDLELGNELENYKATSNGSIGYYEYFYDHLTCDKESVAIINNQMANCVSNKSLCGAGVTWKLCRYIDTQLNTTYSVDLIPYVHVGNMGDICSFTHYEQEMFRYYCELKGYGKNITPFIDALNMGDLSNKGFAFGMNSKVNATIRLGSIEQRRTLYEAFRGIGDVTSVIKSLGSIKAKSDRERDKILKSIEPISDDKVFVGKLKESTPLSGAIAGKICGEKHKPCMLLTDCDDTLSGSCRSVNGVELKSLLNNQSSLFNFNMGHEQAFGTSFPKENLDKIIDYLGTLNCEPIIDVLKSYPYSKAPTSLAHEFAQYNKYYGEGLDIPKFHLKGIPYNASKNVFMLGQYGTTIKVLAGDFECVFTYINKQKKQDLFHLGHVEREGSKDVFISDPDTCDYEMECIGSFSEYDNAESGMHHIEFLVDEFELKKIEKVALF